jgi:FixJ family two-component response regulator
VCALDRDRQDEGHRLGVWLDDHVRELGWADALVEYCHQRGIELRKVDTIEAFEKSVSEDSPSVALVDFRLVGGASGVDVVRRVAPRLRCPVIFLTGWAGDDPAAEKHVDPSLAVQTIDKPHVNTEHALLEDWLHETLKPAWATAEGELSRTEHRLTPDISLPALEILRTPASEIAGKPLNVQLSLAKSAVEGLRGYLQPLFSDGVDWVVIAGEECNILQWGTAHDPPPPAHELEKIEGEVDRVPLVVHRPIEVNLINLGDDSPGWASCRGPLATEASVDDRFPSFEIELDGRLFSLDFDTGSEATFFSYEDFAGETKVPRSQSRHDWNYRDVRIGLSNATAMSFMDFQSSVLCPGVEGSISLQLKALVIHDWRSTRLALKCAGGGCPLSKPDEVSGGFWCGRRVGLIGRDLVLRNRAVVVIDAQAERTYLLPESLLNRPRNASQPEPRRRRWGR